METKYTGFMKLSQGWSNGFCTPDLRRLELIYIIQLLISTKRHLWKPFPMAASMVFS